MMIPKPSPEYQLLALRFRFFVDFPQEFVTLSFRGCHQAKESSQAHSSSVPCVVTYLAWSVLESSPLSDDQPGECSSEMKRSTIRQ